MRTESVQRAILHVHRNHTDALAILHEQVEGKVLDEKVGVVTQRLTVQGVQDGVTGTIGSGGASVSLTALAVLERLSTKGTLVDLAFLGT